VVGVILKDHIPQLEVVVTHMRTHLGQLLPVDTTIGCIPMLVMSVVECTILHMGHGPLLWVEIITGLSVHGAMWVEGITTTTTLPWALLQGVLKTGCMVHGGEV
jgi:hypothetical protein